MTGGSFKAGFLAAAITQGFSRVLDKMNAFAGDVTKFAVRAKNAAVAAVIGGTASVIGGGKFANGAVTATFSRMYNDLEVAIKKWYSTAKLMHARAEVHSLSVDEFRNKYSLANYMSDLEVYGRQLQVLNDLRNLGLADMNSAMHNSLLATQGATVGFVLGGNVGLARSLGISNLTLRVIDSILGAFSSDGQLNDVPINQPHGSRR